MKRRSLLFLLAGVVGCAAGGEAEPPVVAQKYATLDELCRARAEAECNELVVKKCKAKSRDACLAARRSACRASMPQGATYVPTHAEACVRAVESAYRDAQLVASEIGSIEKQCASSLFAGPGGPRASCTVAIDCDGTKGLACFKPWGKDEGKCLVPHEVGPGASCEGEADVCSGGFYCEPNTRVCVARRIDGETCQPGLVLCVETSTCAGGGPFGGGCKAKLSIGEPCRADADCADAVCEKPSGDPNGTCAAALVLSPLSSACTGFGS